MARNAEKAMTTLARWRAAQVQEAGGQRERRPYLASECNDLPQAEKWRLQIVREIAKKVAQIQNEYVKFEVENNIDLHTNTNNMEELTDAALTAITTSIKGSNVRLEDIEIPNLDKVVDVVVDAMVPNIGPFIKSPNNLSPETMSADNPNVPGSPPNPKQTYTPKSPQSPKHSFTLKSPQSPKRSYSPRSPQSPKVSHTPKSPQSPKPSHTPKSPPTPKSPRSYPNSVDGETGSKGNDIVGFFKGTKPPSIKSSKSNRDNILAKAITGLEPQGKIISDHVEKFNESVKSLARDVENSQANGVTTDIDKIANMSKSLTNEAKALRDSIKSLAQDIFRTQQEVCCCMKSEDVNFPYHLFLIEMIINKIHMKCECFDINSNNLVISATFLGKQPIILYDSTYGKIENFNKLNVGKSTLFAMTYDKICSIKEFEIVLLLTKQPACSTCITKIGETHMDYTSEFISLREELCTKWKEQQPTDNILCTTSTPLSKNMYYLTCGTGQNSDSIGIIEVTVRMSFLGKEITTAFCAQPKPQGTSFLLKEDHGMTMYSCQRVEMDDHGKILLDEEIMSKKDPPCLAHSLRRTESPRSQDSSILSKRSCEPYYWHDTHGQTGRYDEIYTKMNVNELKIRVPKSTKVERSGKYDKIQELCSCESTAYNTGEQIQFDLPKDCVYPEKTYTSNLKYTMRGLEKPDKKDRKVINVTPTNCPIPVDMTKMLHPQKDVFILKIGKKLETKDKKTDLEIELVTPKAPSDKSSNDAAKNISAQCSDNTIKKKKKDKKGKGGDKKGKKGAKAKKGKGKKK